MLDSGWGQQDQIAQATSGRLNITQATPEQLLSLAKVLARQEEGDRHWSILAQVLGRVDVLSLFETKEFGSRASTRAWAVEALGIDHRDVDALLWLYRMIAANEPSIKPEQWHAIKKVKARILLQVFKLGVEEHIMAEWLAKAIAMTTAELSAAYKAAAGEEVWVKLALKVPQSTGVLFHEAMDIAKGMAEGDAVHQRFEIILAVFVQGVSGQTRIKTTGGTNDEAGA